MVQVRMLLENISGTRPVKLNAGNTYLDYSLQAAVLTLPSMMGKTDGRRCCFMN